MPAGQAQANVRERTNACLKPVVTKLSAPPHHKQVNVSLPVWAYRSSSSTLT